ncbi:hypothetical protein BGZ60DRAFT_252241 [Tricladium varicosporioides]|nr:hypothetical protein BGZ60DRAFT_252241 [Hymenoscyphus varicosporioides]
MDPHALAIAALNQVTESAGHSRDIPDKLAASNPNATGIDMATAMIHNTTVDSSTSHAQELSRASGPSTAVTGKEDTMGQYNDKVIHAHSNESDNSQSTNESQDVATPPTSTSEGFSSQGTNQDGPMSQLSQLSQLAAAQQPLTSTSRPTLSIPSAAGQKRTADGQVKSGGSGSPESPKKRGHSRNTSNVSSASVASSRIGEISAELRTRLSYAMVKVNNGWQSNSIDEVESLASQAGSPTSSNSTLHGRRNVITSPRTAIANIQGQVSGPSSQQSGDFDLYSTSGQPSRTYESFWRDHSAVPAHRYSSHPSQSSPPTKSLAPPADIRPTLTSRRSGTPKFSKPPTMPGQHSNSSLRSSTPRTPNRHDYRDNTIIQIQTPTQKTIQEQDAIETLLFMSSPGNSGNMGPNPSFPPRSQASPQQSPLRAEFNMQRHAHGKKVGFDVPAISNSTESSEAGGAEYRSRHMIPSTSSTRSREAAIDRMLDEMGDSSSDEEELVVKYSSPRRSVAAGR